MTISEAERAKRAEDVARIQHSIEMEGGQVSRETAADLLLFVDGLLDEGEMLRRADLRHGLRRER